MNRLGQVKYKPSKLLIYFCKKFKCYKILVDLWNNKWCTQKLPLFPIMVKINLKLSMFIYLYDANSTYQPAGFTYYCDTNHRLMNNLFLYWQCVITLSQWSFQGHNHCIGRYLNINSWYWRQRSVTVYLVTSLSFQLQTVVFKVISSLFVS